MTKPLTIMLCAGEPSSDALGATLMAELRAMRPGVRLIGVGGSAMEAQGLVSLFGIGELAIMGVGEVLPKLRSIFRRINQTADFALRTKPDAIVLIDSGDFNNRVAKRVRAGNPALRIIKYVSSQVWAWRPGRALKMKALYDHVLCLLPFEPPFYEQHGLAASFVGHPAIRRAEMVKGGGALRERLGIAADAKVLCVLPGSRRFEVRNLLPIFRSAVTQIAGQVPGLVCIMPTVPNVEAAVRAAAADWPVPIHVVTGETDRFATFDAADVALACSGTVTTELAVAGVPMVAAYEVGWLNSFIARQMVKIRYMTIVNLVLDRPAIPEFHESRGRAAEIAAKLLPLLSDPAAFQAQKADLAEASAKLGSGIESGRRAAEIVLGYAEGPPRA